tara:strand:- start:4398 stop:8864 length:4467 start_codon:yes stop_codon:yes gene_type:complete
MADGNLVRQSNVGKGAVVFGPSAYDVPLLPYEKELIKTIGITEEEYKKFAAEVRRKGAVRPAEYEHIPDILNTADPVTNFFIYLAVSLVLTGASYLLTPKPKMPEASKRTQLDLGSINAANRFTPSRGFDSLSELADYGSPIPIIFGLYDKGKDVGGMLITPKLVWSRMFSHGAQQSAKLLFVVGEQGFADAQVSGGQAPDGIIEPDLEGIFLGNNALDAIYEDFFAFYWKRNSPIEDLAESASSFNRVQRRNLRYGTAGAADRGDPNVLDESDADVFVCPDNKSNRSTSFCHAFTPSNNTQFGVYGAVPNGNGYRVNYEVVSIIEGDDTKAERQQAFNLTLRRMKIVGDKNLNTKANNRDQLKKVRKQNMEGTGRQYSPRMGITKLIRDGDSNSPYTVPDGKDNFTRVLEVKKGDKVEFIIHPTKIDEDKYQRQGGDEERGGENVDDINSTVESEQLAADEAMQVGEQFAIAGTKWRVTDRSEVQFDPDGEDPVKITLECTDVSESKQKLIGIVSRQNVVNPSRDFISDKGGVGAGFFPITRVATGIVRNNKPAVVTEIGLRSRVFQRLNGLCAFNTVPTPGELEDFDDNEVQVRSGTYTGNIMRSSVFQVYVREAGKNKVDDKEYKFKRIDIYFVVKGNRPVDQYNFLRFTHPAKEAMELEFKFVSVPGSELRALPDDQEMIQLIASTSNKAKVREPHDVPGLGRIEVETVGQRIRKQDIKLNKEFLRKPRTNRVRAAASIPKSVSRKEVLPQDQSPKFKRAIAIEFVDNFGNLDVPGRAGAFFSTIFGNPDNFPVGSEQSKEQRDVFGDKWIRVKWKVKIAALPADHYARQNGVQSTFNFVDAEVIGSSPRFSKDEIIAFRRGQGSTLAGGSQAAYPDSNKFKNNHPSGSSITFSGFNYRVTKVDTTRAPEGRSGGYYYELFGDPSDLAIGTTKSTTRTLTKGSAQLKIKVFVIVKALPDNHFTGLRKTWEQEKVTVIDDGFTNSGWDKGDCVPDEVSISPGSNPFYWTYSRVGFNYEISDLVEAPKTVQLSGETEFEGQSQYADISFYRGLVQKSNESEPEHTIVYVNEVLPNSKTPEYGGLTLAGLSLKASRNFTSLDQLRCWIGKGLSVKRLHPDYNNAENNPYGNSSSETFQHQYGPSNLFTDLVFYLLTSQIGGAGTLTGMSTTNPSLLNEDDFVATSRYLRKQELFFNGVIGERTNLRQYIQDTAPYFLCHFVIMDGKFSLLPALPYNAESGNINTGPVVIDQLFTAGNILEDSYKIEYLRSEERRSFKAVMRYRFESRNKLPEERVMEVTLKKEKNTAIPEEQFDLTQFCTSREHAKKVAQYFLGIRKFVTHTISFSTTVEGLNLRAGSYIKVATTSTPYNSANNGTIDSTGAVTSVRELADGSHKVFYYKTVGAEDDVREDTIQVTAGRVENDKFHSSVFTVVDDTVGENIYIVEQLTFSQEGTVDIVASEHPCDSDQVSELAKLVNNPDSVHVQDI